MAGSTISGKVTTTVTLGSASYPSPLTITSAGDVAASGPSAIGIDAPAGSGIVINDGTVTGGAASGDGGVGVDLATGAALTNQGTITGGAGSPGIPGPGGTVPGPAGAGVLIDGGTLTNSGAIAGGYAFGGSNPEGSGAVLLAGTLSNTGTIAGGSSPLEPVTGGSFGSRYGDGVYLAAAATLLNTNGTIAGGDNPVGGGSGIFLAAGGTLAITGVVIGGGGAKKGGSGVWLADGGSLGNTGTVIGGSGVSGVGVYLLTGGTLTNAGTIIGGRGVTSIYNSGVAPGGSGVVLAAGGILINAAFISGGSATGAGAGAMGSDGVDLVQGGTLTNNAGATITGGAGGYDGGDGIYGGGTGAGLVGGTLTNAGTITGGSGVGIDKSLSIMGGNGGTGVSLTGGAILTNTGRIDGGLAGYNEFGEHAGTGVVIGSSATASTLVNSGVITGGNADDVAPGGANYFFFDSGTVTGGTGAFVGSGDTLINNGIIIGGIGAYVGADGTLGPAGAVSGGDGVTVATGGTLVNTGTVISGVGAYLANGAWLTVNHMVSGGIYGGVTADAVLFAGAGTLAVDPGARFVGQIAANATAADTLVLTPGGGSPGTLSGIGTQFTNFAQIIVGADASWTLAGANTVAAGTTLAELSFASLTDTGTLVNDGSIVLDPSTMTLAALIGTGPVAIDAGSTLEVRGTISGGETLVFGGSGAYLHLDSPDSVAGSITNFTSGETIDLKGINPATVSYTSGDLTFSGGGDIPLELASGGMVVVSRSTDGAEITVLCFCANTLILTPSGERPVQDLAVGDLVTTHRGKVRPIAWIGVGKVLATRGRRSAATPVIVRRGALAENVPNRDLRVTKGHAFLLDGVLIPVEFLVNHRLIEWDERAQEVDLYHVELASHDVLVANGAPAETYRDDGNRWLFRNANSGWDLPPQVPCAPVLTGGPVVDAVWRRLLRRAGPRPGFVLTDDPDLHLLVDGDRLDARGRRGAARIFHLPAQPAAVRVVSRSAAPAELGLARDPRVLGVAIRRIALRQGTRFHVVEAADAALTQGFYPFEQVDGVRWTDGDAALPEVWFKDFDGPMELVLYVGGATRYALFGTADLRAAAA